MNGIVPGLIDDLNGRSPGSIEIGDRIVKVFCFLKILSELRIWTTFIEIHLAQNDHQWVNCISLRTITLPARSLASCYACLAGCKNRLLHNRERALQSLPALGTQIHQVNGEEGKAFLLIRAFAMSLTDGPKRLLGST